MHNAPPNVDPTKHAAVPHTIEKGSLVFNGKSLLHDVSLPAAVIHDGVLTHNIAWMQRFAAGHGAKLAPHGKTTMTPALFKRQLDAGAWGITLATATQCAVAFQHGVTRLLMANQLVGPANMALIADIIVQGAEYYCVVDSVENVAALGAFFAERGLRLQVLVELGVEGGRCGVRSAPELDTLIAAIGEQSALALAGIEGYEGIIGGPDPAASVRAYGDRLVDTVLTLKRSGKLAVTAPLVTASGSKWFDLIAEAFDRAELRNDYTPVLRPGCYVVHDHKLYAGAMADVKARHPNLASGLEPALTVFAHVQSLPESGLAIVALGKRDIGCDPDLPMPLMLYRNGDSARDISSWQVTQIMDQHVFMKIPKDADIAIGDTISFGTSHPCLTFDKWRQIVLVNDELEVLDTMKTYF